MNCALLQKATLQGADHSPVAGLQMLVIPA